MAKAHTLVDSFSDGSAGAQWTVYATHPATDRIREVNGRVEIRPDGNRTVASYASYVSGLHDLSNSEVRVEVVRALRQVENTITWLGVKSPDDSENAQIRIQGNEIRCTWNYAGGGGFSVLVAYPYDPQVHRWLRIRVISGMMSWEASPDAKSWIVLHQNGSPFSPTSVKVEFGAGTHSAVAWPGVAIFDNFNTAECGNARRVEERRFSAREVRDQAADVAAARRHDEHANNNDEVNYPGFSFIGSYSKSLPHDAVGDPDPAAYGTLLRALQSEDPADFEEIRLASSTAVKFTNPQAGLAFDIAGPDAQERTMPPAPRFDSEVTAHEAGELYWMAVLRDLPFVDYGTDGNAAQAIASLNGEFPRFGGTAPVTAQNLFRGIHPGEQVGPYVSQFLLKGNVDPRKPAGQGRDAADGFISYGARNIDQRLFPAAGLLDYLHDFPTWLDVQNGVDKRGQDSFDTTKRFIWNLRAGATFVHFDQVLDAFYNAAWILMSEPVGNQLTVAGATGRPQIDAEFPKDQGNPYDPPGTSMDSRTQVGFATFGPTHLLQALPEVMGRALRAVWWQKWGVHRRLRPEEYGGRLDNWIQGRRDYPLHPSLKNSLTTGALAPFYGNAGERFPQSYLLPQAYPEGAPTHPAYGAGHATGSGALVTILKAFFDDTAPIENPVQPSFDGLALATYTGADAGQMTVGGELNKLAGNIAIFRNAAGVHWRSDYTESLPFGEAIAIGLLQEMSLGFNEDDAFFQLTKFDGQTIRIFDGKVVPVV